MQPHLPPTSLHNLIFGDPVHDDLDFFGRYVSCVFSCAEGGREASHMAHGHETKISTQHDARSRKVWQS